MSDGRRSIGMAVSPDEIEQVRALFLEYARSLGFSLCFEGFDREMAGLPGSYSPPGGRLLAAWDGSTAIGCVGVKPAGDGSCEMKRLYVRLEARRRRIGRALAEAAIAGARAAGYRRMRLETLDSMAAARKLYASLGFAPMPADRGLPAPEIIRYELDLPRSAHVPAA